MTMEQILSEIAELKASIDKLIALPAVAVDLTPVHDAIVALKAQVDAAIPPTV